MRASIIIGASINANSPLFSLIFKKSGAWLGGVVRLETALVASAILLVSEY